MSNCNFCLSREVCRHNDGHNLWCKGECPQYKSECNMYNEWINIKDQMPKEWVSVIGYMTDSGDFPSVRECYSVDGNFFFPALNEFHPISHWMEFPEKPAH